MPNFLKKMFTGRMGRKEFLVPGLFFVMLPILLSVLLVLVVIVSESRASGVAEFLFLTLLFLIPPLLPYVRPIIKRFHDIGLSGWFSLILYLTIPALLWFHFFFINFIAAVILSVFLTPTLLNRISYIVFEENLLLSLVVLILSLVHIFAILFLFLRHGSEMENRYGAVAVYKKKRIRKLYQVLFVLLTCITIICYGLFVLFYLAALGMSNIV